MRWWKEASDKMKAATFVRSSQKRKLNMNKPFDPVPNTSQIHPSLRTSRATAAEMKINFSVRKSKQFLEKKEGAVPEKQKPPKSSKRKEPTGGGDKVPSQSSASKKLKKQKKSK